MSIDVKDVARRIILNHAQDVEFLSIWEMTEDDMAEAELDEDQQDAFVRSVDDLIGKATVTVTWADEQAESEPS